MLTVAREKFVAAIIEGKSQRQAYYEAYPGSRNWKPENVDSKASTLAKDAKVSARINELRAKIEAETIKKNVWNRQKAQETLMWLIETAKNQVEQYEELSSPVVSGIMGAVKELNEIAGIKTEKTDQEDNGLIGAINNSSEGVWDGVREIQPEANEGTDLVGTPEDIS